MRKLLRKPFYITIITILLTTPLLKPKTKIKSTDFCHLTDQELEQQITILRATKKDLKKKLRTTKKELSSCKRIRRKRLKLRTKEAFLSSK
jgi:hypothetical protein